MNSSIKALRSTFNLMLSIVELVIGLSFAIKIFGSKIAPDEGLFEFIDEVLEKMGGGASGALGSLDLAGPSAFLLLVLGFMVFSFTLLAQIPKIIKQSKRSLETEYD